MSGGDVGAGLAVGAEAAGEPRRRPGSSALLNAQALAGPCEQPARTRLRKSV